MDEVSIGQGATVRIGSDSYGCTVVNVENFGDIVTVQNDTATPGEGHDYYSKQVWVHSPNQKGACYVFRWSGSAWRHVKKNIKTGRWNATNKGYRVSFGERHTYQDPSF